jgi:hypothetical protein
MCAIIKDNKQEPLNNATDVSHAHQDNNTIQLTEDVLSQSLSLLAAIVTNTGMDHNACNVVLTNSVMPQTVTTETLVIMLLLTNATRVKEFNYLTANALDANHVELVPF